MEVGTNVLREPFKAKPTPQEAELMMLAFVYAEHVDNIDYDKIAEHFGYKSGTVAKDRLRQIKRKLFGPGGGAKATPAKDKETPSKKRTRKAKAADDDDAEENGDAEENPTPTKKPRRKAAPKKKQLSEEKIEEEEDELPEKKPEAEAEDDDYAEDEV